MLNSLLNLRKLQKEKKIISKKIYHKIRDRLNKIDFFLLNIILNNKRVYIYKGLLNDYKISYNIEYESLFYEKSLRNLDYEKLYLIYELLNKKEYTLYEKKEENEFFIKNKYLGQIHRDCASSIIESIKGSFISDRFTLEFDFSDVIHILDKYSCSFDAFYSKFYLIKNNKKYYLYDSSLEEIELIYFDLLYGKFRRN